jgi:hypothetical protein
MACSLQYGLLIPCDKIHTNDLNLILLKGTGRTKSNFQMDATTNRDKIQELICPKFHWMGPSPKGRLSHHWLNANSYISSLTPTPTQQNNPANNG